MRNENNSFKDTAKSVGSAFLGVQSEANRKRDFTKGKFSHFVIAGIIGVMLLIGALILVVNLVAP